VAEITVQVEYGPVLREAAGVRQESVRLNRTSIAALIEHVTRSHPGKLASWLIDAKTGEPSGFVMVILNGQETREDVSLHDGDDVTFMPVISGG
jgi:molybdopterin converting factor small subunit